MKRPTPFHTGKVAIGLLYQPKPRPPQGDALVLQRALLESRTKQQPSAFARLFGRISQWL